MLRELYLQLTYQYVDIINSFNFNKVETYIRLPENSQDTSSTEDILKEVIIKLNLKEDLLLAQATSPLTTTEDINKGMQLYLQYDSILSVVEQKRFIWSKDGYPVNYDYNKRPRRQDFEGYFVENGAFYINTAENILKYKSRLSGKIGLYKMSELTYLELDSKYDFKAIEKLLENKF